jgi:hypothetical protein
MTSSIKKTKSDVIYTVTHSDWVCEWILSEGIIKRSFHFTEDLDPLNDSHNERIRKIIPGLLFEVKSTVQKWIHEGHEDARKFLLADNKPAFLEYAERILLQINQQG